MAVITGIAPSGQSTDGRLSRDNRSAGRVHHDETVKPSVSRLWRREFANQRPPDFLFVFNERLGLLRSVVPDRHAEVRVAFLDRQRVERLAKSVGETALDRLRDPSWRGKRHE